MAMAEYAVQLDNVTKQYKNTTAVNRCTLNLESGKIYGLVGRNGAGKTTLMRLIAGLCIPTEGSIRRNVKKTGTLIEAPGINGGMTAMENLHFYRLLAGQKETRQADTELLELVGLANTGKKKAKDFSLGMRQRLGIAIALIGRPELVMLDEPVNGLDPLGVVEIRKLIKKLNQEYHMTVLVSSHNLPELYQTATDYIIVDQGTVKREVTQQQLEAADAESLEDYFLAAIQ